MRNAALRLVSQLELPSTLVVVFPALAMNPGGMLATMKDFVGSKVVIIHDTSVPSPTLPDGLQRCIDAQREHADIMMLSADMFGNRRGLVLPVDLAVEIVSEAGLLRRQDRILVTGCYRGWLPGSIEVLAEALSALHYDVEVDARVPRR